MCDSNANLICAYVAVAFTFVIEKPTRTVGLAFKKYVCTICNAVYTGTHLLGGMDHTCYDVNVCAVTCIRKIPDMYVLYD